MTYADHLIEQYRAKGLLLDSNLLLLHVVGTINPDLIGSNKLTRFTLTEMELPQVLTAQFRRMVTTAHILTEVSNLTSDWDSCRRRAIFEQFASSLDMVEEYPVSSYQAARRPEFSYLGLTDTVLATVSNDFLIVSNDGRMVDLMRDRAMNALKWVEVLGLEA